MVLPVDGLAPLSDSLTGGAVGRDVHHGADDVVGLVLDRQMELVGDQFDRRRDDADGERPRREQLLVQGMDWIEIIGARRTGESLLAAKTRKSPSHGPPSTVAQIEFDLRRWDGPVGDWSEHFGKAGKQVHSLDGGEPLRSCQEVEVAKRLRAARDQAFWFRGLQPDAGASDLATVGQHLARRPGLAGLARHDDP
jgi:hypothetical protein